MHPAPLLPPDPGGATRKRGSAWRPIYRIDAGTGDRLLKRSRSSVLNLTDFDGSELDVGTGFGKLHRFVVVAGFNDEEPTHHFLRFNERAVGNRGLPVLFAEHPAFAVGQFWPPVALVCLQSRYFWVSFWSSSGLSPAKLVLRSSRNNSMYCGIIFLLSSARRKRPRQIDTGWRIFYARLQAGRNYFAFFCFCWPTRILKACCLASWNAL